MIRFAKLPILFNLKAMQDELSLHNNNWQAHFNTYYYEGSWTAMALRSPGGSIDNIIPDLIADAEYNDTLFMQHFPSVQTLLSGLHCPVMAVRFLNLQAGAVIKPHRDNELAFEKGEARLHFPVMTNPKVLFCVENEHISLQEGDCWYINANLKHNVANNGATDRVHMVIDLKVNDWLGRLMEMAEIVSVKEDDTTSDLAAIIRELRHQNTETSNKLADDMELQQKE